MSGIAGLVRLRGPARDDGPTLVRRMLAMMAHRGPDSSTVYRSDSGRAVLGECRGGDSPESPSSEPAGRLPAVLDGQVYNAVALRHALSFAGHQFHGTSDAELAARCFEQHGLDGLNQINGRFALAVWDDRVDRLILARDRLGKKPLYVIEHDGLLLFASEIKALTAAVPFRRRIDPVALRQYLAWGYVAPPLTMFQGVGKLGAGEALVVEPGGSFRRLAWWQPCQDSRQAVRHRNLPRPAQEDALRRLLETSVADRIAPHSALACLVDGSSFSLMVGMLAARLAGRRLDTVVVHDAAAAVPRRLTEGMDLPLYPVGLGPRQVIAMLPDLVRHLDEPVADPAAPFAWAGARALKDHGAAVALTGDGADDLLPADGASPRRGLLAWLTSRLGRPDEGAGGGGLFADAALQRLIGPRSALPDRASRAAQTLHGRLSECRLMRADKTAMAHGIELRAPLLDHRLVDHLLALRGGAGGDALVVERLGGRVAPCPAEVLGGWMAGGPLAACYEEVVRRSRLFDDGLLDRAASLALLRRHRADGRQAARLWAVLMLAEWYDLFWVAHVDSEQNASPPWPSHPAAAE